MVTNNLRKFGIGAYFDMYSDNQSDWNLEVIYNNSINVECLEVLLEFPGGTKYFDKHKSEHLKSLLKGIYIATHAPTINLSLVCMNDSILRASIEEHKRAIDVSKILGANLMTIHGGEYPYYTSLNGTSPSLIFNKCISELIPYAKDRGVTIQVENLKNKHIFPQSIKELDFILDSNYELMLALDLRHACINNLSPLELFRKYRSRVTSIQYREDCGMDDGELLMLFKELNDTDFRGYFIVEDSVLNASNKSEKPMIERGIKKINMCMDKINLENMGGVLYDKR
ncbi:TPA: sugar phosphate isomerase/epimerase [Vibrio parahaemolyticus]|nr:TIM barrel protein [Vibrio parahaemolyticus]HBC0000828.1 sugar phosphate isomerase/epimerase [Vibrio parahaemolyticus]HBC3834131.1 sugar phosphate isomerase/epimerase [Vibrio parahaemolyticus]